MILTQIYQIISVIEIDYFMLPLCMLNWQIVLVHGNYRPALQSCILPTITLCST